jgi:Asp-tRNA(Asn)/Glu-tRNA(Gln) amidotransferase A subunit family amidase
MLVRDAYAAAEAVRRRELSATELIDEALVQIEPVTADLIRAGEGKTARKYLDALHERAAYTWCHLCYPANLTGQPAISLPTGFGDDGLPVGPRIMGRRFDETTLLAVPAAFERLAPWGGQVPPLRRESDGSTTQTAGQ